MSSKEFELLGKAVNELPTSPNEAQLDSFPNKHKMRNYIVEFNCADFMSMCPITQQSDFAKIHIRYIPGEECIETKSLKFYLQSYRSQKTFNEEIVNRILTDLVAACNPNSLIALVTKRNSSTPFFPSSDPNNNASKTFS